MSYKPKPFAPRTCDPSPGDRSRGGGAERRGYAGGAPRTAWNADRWRDSERDAPRPSQPEAMAERAPTVFRQVAEQQEPPPRRIPRERREPQRVWIDHRVRPNTMTDDEIASELQRITAAVEQIPTHAVEPQTLSFTKHATLRIQALTAEMGRRSQSSSPQHQPVQPPAPPLATGPEELSLDLLT